MCHTVPLVEALSSEALRLRDSREVAGAVAEEDVLSSATIVDLILLPIARMLRTASSSGLVEDLDLVEFCCEVKANCQKSLSDPKVVFLKKKIPSDRIIGNHKIL